MPTAKKSASKAKAAKAPKEARVEQSMSAAQYEELIERYKEQNPAKYEAKKAELEAKLAALS